MTTTAFLIIAGTITLLSLLLKFSRMTRENLSIFISIRKKSSEILNIISLQQEPGVETSEGSKRFRLAISDWFSALTIVIISYKLLSEYASIDMLSRASVFKIGLLFSLLLFNIIILAVSTIERRLGYWIDEFMTVIEHIFKLLQPNTLQKNKIISRTRPARTSSKKKKQSPRTARK